MKRTSIFIIILLLMIGFAASSQDFFLLPHNFYVHKGDKLNLHLLSGNEFKPENEFKLATAKATKFLLYEGSKKTDLSKVSNSADSSLLVYELQNSGLALFELVRDDETESERNKFIRALESEGLDKMAEEARASSQQYFVEKYHQSSKTLISVDKANGKDFDKPLGEEYEIVIQQNPYKSSYGDDVTAQVLFRGKPMKDAVVMQYVRTLNGTIVPQKLLSDSNGLVFFKLSREGYIWLAQPMLNHRRIKKPTMRIGVLLSPLPLAIPMTYQIHTESLDLGISIDFLAAAAGLVAG
ncbi:DUF4198 domain-containing protein [Mucilaginibacter sp. P4]|uniref:DUF4198 domain-containing protein n=1 Tax=Mucilaginibacter sp. P4 TaxID=3383180 RepID=UPI0011EF5A70|nr:DUF4198 domain-containing protein [Mucilaginibacter gossypii]QEM19881.1 DUF4198 domain-containing protein [Mucilaginibacter gossypii]